MPRTTPIDALKVSLNAGRRKRILFVSARGAARGIIAEAIVNRHSAAGYQAGSAGRRPAEILHPKATELLRAFHAPPGRRRPGLFDPALADSFDYVVTLHDQMKGEPCPLRDIYTPDARWDVADPRDGQNPRERVVSSRLSFVRTYCALRRQISGLLNDMQSNDDARVHVFNARRAETPYRPAPRRAPARRLARPALDAATEPLTLSTSMLIPPRRG